MGWSEWHCCCQSWSVVSSSELSFCSSGLRYTLTLTCTQVLVYPDSFWTVILFQHVCFESTGSSHKCSWNNPCTHWCRPTRVDKHTFNATTQYLPSWQILQGANILLTKSAEGMRPCNRYNLLSCQYTQTQQWDSDCSPKKVAYMKSLCNSKSYRTIEVS